jgi:hypothetical protein
VDIAGRASTVRQPLAAGVIGERLFDGACATLLYLVETLTDGVNVPIVTFGYDLVSE